MVTALNFLFHKVIERLFGLTKNYLGVCETRKNPILTGSLCLVRKILFLVLIDEMTKYYAELAHFTAVRNKRLSENIQWSHIKCTRTKVSLPDDKTRNNYSLPDNFATRFLNNHKKWRKFELWNQMFWKLLLWIFNLACSKGIYFFFFFEPRQSLYKVAFGLSTHNVTRIFSIFESIEDLDFINMLWKFRDVKLKYIEVYMLMKTLFTNLKQIFYFSSPCTKW